MKKQVSSSISVFFCPLVVIFLSVCTYSSSSGAAKIQSADGKPCVDGTIVLASQADAPARLYIQKATCGDFSSNVDLRLENISTKQIKGYEVSQTKDYENIQGVKSSHIHDGVEIPPGESVNVKFNGGFLEGYSYGKPVGLFKRDTYSISWIRFSDGSQWGQIPKTIQDPPPGHDLKLRDDHEAFVVAFQYANNSFSVMSCGEYGFAGPGLKIETNGCSKQFTFDFRWHKDFSYHLRKKPDVTITIKAGDNIHGEFIFDSCAHTARGFIRNENQNLILMNLSDTDTSGKRAYCSGPPDYNEEKTFAEFERLYSAWHQECETIRFSSNTYDYIGLPSYRKIVAIGKPALPSLEQKMAEDKGLDFMLAFAVVEICGWDRQEFRGGSEQEFRDRVLRKLRQK